MPDVRFTTMIDGAHAEEVVAMMRALYAKSEGSVPGLSRFPLTIERLLKDPNAGRIVLFMEGRSLCGYSLLIPYWSNEFGGTLLFVDELFVISEARSRGIGRQFFQFLSSERPFRPVAIALEVSPDNPRARKFYESIGFAPRQLAVLTLTLTAAESAA